MNSYFNFNTTTAYRLRQKVYDLKSLAMSMNFTGEQVITAGIKSNLLRMVIKKLSSDNFIPQKKTKNLLSL